MLDTTDQNPPAVILVDDDTLFLKTFGANLERAGYKVNAFSDPATALQSVQQSHEHSDAYILDWHMPRMDGLELLNRLREAGVTAPIMFLTSLNQPLFEEMALEHGAVEFVKKTRSPAVIIKRLELVITGARLKERPARVADTIDLGRLSLKPEAKRAHWQGREVPLSLGEFEVVALLAAKAGIDVSYREIYNTVQAEGFIAGQGAEGYRTNVRALIKRIRRKFTEADPAFAALENYPGFGYRWRGNA